MERLCLCIYSCFNQQLLGSVTRISPWMNVNLGLTWFKALLPWLKFFIWCQILVANWNLSWNWKLELIPAGPSLSGKHQCNIHVRDVYFHDKWMRNKNNPLLTKQPQRWQRDLVKPCTSHRWPCWVLVSEPH